MEDEEPPVSLPSHGICRDTGRPDQATLDPTTSSTPKEAPSAFMNDA